MGLNLDIPGIGNNGKKKKKRKGATKSQWLDIISGQDFKCKYFDVGYKCHKKFGKSSGLTPEIHHKDGNRGNNDPTNLIALCPDCHQKAGAKLRKKKAKDKDKKSKRDDSKIRYNISVPKKWD